MAIRNYVGARYVPKFANPVEWQANTSYEAMVIVTYNNASYTSKVPVPPTVGNPAENSTYWALTGNYNAQVEEYRKATAEAQEDINELKTKTGTNTNDIKDLKIKDTTIESELSSHINNESNPHGVTKDQVGLGNVDNVSKANILQSVYPVGSIYQSTVDTSPAVLFGGTWEPIYNTFLIATGHDFPAGSTGGHITMKLLNTHLPQGTVINRRPSKTITIPAFKTASETVTLTTNDYAFGSNSDFANAENLPNIYGQEFSIMPPYIAVYVWKRIA